MNREKPYPYGNMFVQSAIANNTGKEDDVKHVEEVYETALRDRFIGRGAHDHCVNVEIPVMHAVAKTIENKASCDVDKIQTQQTTGLMRPFQTTGQNYGVPPVFDFLNYANTGGAQTNDFDASLLLSIVGPSVNQLAPYSYQQASTDDFESLQPSSFPGPSMTRFAPY